MPAFSNHVSWWTTGQHVRLAALRAEPADAAAERADRAADAVRVVGVLRPG